ncbi:sce7725 family protein [Enterococcus sp. BWB1-3]|uniref:sce7725 family protein n=1 Tax=Enterococcus sp. BWB1-3 TaxID=2787713 RepID=UPI001922C61B|nr:sce7725 family protein [Enterococcus sp. BWB1-3]MBL1229189.1 sce7725 family protein [Enterococcus sp. BWB1-3]
MYYPYFRGKQFDLLALTALLEKERLSRNILPIIEPVKNSNALKKLLSESQKKQHPFYLIQNPQSGDFLTAEGVDFLNSLPSANALIIKQPIETLDETPELLIVNESTPILESDWLNNQTAVLLPEEFRLLQKIKGPKILSQDVFTRLPKTIFYQEVPDELFSTTHLSYKKRGFVGFSDFSIDSRIYYEGGYPSPILSLHLVYFEGRVLRIHHFLSSEEAPSQQDKFFELMNEVTDWLKKLCGDTPTLGIQLLIDSVNIQKFPGMGVMRKAAVMHHLELMSRYLDNQFLD